MKDQKGNYRRGGMGLLIGTLFGLIIAVVSTVTGCRSVQTISESDNSKAWDPNLGLISILEQKSKRLLPPVPGASCSPIPGCQSNMVRPWATT